MEYILLIFCIVNTILLVAIANTIARSVHGKAEKNGYKRGYNKGSLDTLFFIKSNLSRHSDILPSWIPEWFDKMIVSYKNRKKELEDVKIKYEGQLDYSNILELQKPSEDIRIIKDE